MTRWSIATFAGLVLGTLLWLAIAAAVGTFGHRISRWDYTFRGGPSDDARLVAWLAEQPGFLRPQVERQPGRLRVRYLYDEPHADVNDKAVEFALRYLFGYDVTWTSSRLGSWAPVALLEDDTGEQLRCGGWSLSRLGNLVVARQVEAVPRDRPALPSLQAATGRTRRCSRRRGHVGFPRFVAHSAPAAAELGLSAAEGVRMGLNAYLKVNARREYRKYPSASPTALAEFDLNRGWTPLDLALRTMPAPLGLALRGNRPTVEEFEDDWEA